MITNNNLDLQDARRLAVACIAGAEELAICIAVAVVDAAGHVLVLNRMDGTQLAGPTVAVAKAMTAALFRKPSKHFEDLASTTQRSALLMLPTVFDGLAVEGGVPVFMPVPGTDNLECVGAIGVSGGRSDQDAEVAERAIVAFVAGWTPAAL